MPGASRRDRPPGRTLGAGASGWLPEQALAALDPHHELSVLLHGRITEALRRLRRYDATDLEVRQVADLDYEELLQAAGVVRAIRALPSWSDKSYHGGTGFRVVLSGYALDLADEIDKRGRDKS